MALTTDNFTQDQIDELTYELSHITPYVPTFKSVHVMSWIVGATDGNDATAPHSFTVVSDIAGEHGDSFRLAPGIGDAVELHDADFPYSGQFDPGHIISLAGITATIAKTGDHQYTLTVVSNPGTDPRGYFIGEQAWTFAMYNVPSESTVSASISSVDRSLSASNRASVDVQNL